MLLSAAKLNQPIMNVSLGHACTSSSTNSRKSYNAGFMAFNSLHSYAFLGHRKETILLPHQSTEGLKPPNKAKNFDFE